MKQFVLILVGAVCLLAEQPSEQEKRDLRDVLGEAGSSPVELIRGLEKHLAKYPRSSQKDDIDRTIAKAAVEVKDGRRTVLYGERVLALDPNNAMMLERVARALLDTGNPADAERAVKHSRKFEEVLIALENTKPDRTRPGMWDELDRAISRALTYQARGAGISGKHGDAVALAKRSFDRHPNAEAARELGRWLAEAGQHSEAMQAYANAFALSEGKTADEDRASDRDRLGQIYKKLHGSEDGLGDLLLKAFDRTSALKAKRLELLRERDPNFDVTDPMDYTLTALDGSKLRLSNLRGKVVVMDFWATWCGPCRAQHPLYDEVKKKFSKNGEVVVLSINTDEDRTPVLPFLEANSWSKTVYFEDGLSDLLRVTSIPTTIIVDKKGRLYSRLNGFLPDRFVDMLTERIQGALQAE